MRWTDSASEADPTGAEGAGVGAEAAAIGEATLRGGRPEGEAVPASVAARAGGSPRLENPKLLEGPHLESRTTLLRVKTLWKKVLRICS